MNAEKSFEYLLIRASSCGLQEKSASTLGGGRRRPIPGLHYETVSSLLRVGTRVNLAPSAFLC